MSEPTIKLPLPNGKALLFDHVTNHVSVVDIGLLRLMGYG